MSAEGIKCQKQTRLSQRGFHERGCLEKICHRLDHHRSGICVRDEGEITPEVRCERQCWVEFRVYGKDGKGTNLDVLEIV